MKIKFDVTQFLLQNGFQTPTGISRVELAYVKHLLEQKDYDVSFVTSYPPFLNRIDRSKIEDYVHATELCWGTEGDAKQNVAQRRRTALSAIRNATRNGILLKERLSQISSGSTEIYLSVSGWRLPTPWVASWLLKRPETKPVFLLHDIIPLSHPEYVRKKSRQKYKVYLERILRSGALILANSEDTKQELLKHCVSKGILAPQIETLPLGVSPSVRNRPVSPEPTAPYFMVIGTVEPRKNHHLLIEAWKRMLKEAEGKQVPKLFIVGKLGWSGSKILNALAQEDLLQDHVVHITGASDETIALMLQRATGVLFPSFVEGYGLPLVEALGKQVPVICSDLAVFRELGGEYPRYVSPDDIEGWISAIQDLTNQSPSDRMAEIERLEGFSAYQWKDHFAQLDRLLRALPDKASI
ncbi:glycosyltransferase family 1 protein [Aliiroseovarius sp. PrR006]|uniref:glycosyltransferase family 4 protein n=1 Tax=Aliiroseovarius sp. PrR006 TaxID=2706883 RepID=UPI0013D62271|nr:glycosyltransferase family 1 protein [Aliiroseovarius sp. PrR006]NDW54606.1 glycosyltransferase family 4 protein [Aliiroseovarius sp. PrR006]